MCQSLAAIYPLSTCARYCFIENLHGSGLMSDAEYAVLDQWFQWITENADVKPDLIGECGSRGKASCYNCLTLGDSDGG